MQTSRVEGWKLESRLGQTDDLQNLYMALPSLALGINRIEQGLVSSVYQDDVIAWDIG